MKWAYSEIGITVDLHSAILGSNPGGSTTNKMKTINNIQQTQQQLIYLIG